MSLEDLNVKINFKLADAQDALAKLGQVRSAVDVVSEHAAAAEFRARAFATSLSTVGAAARPLSLISGNMSVLSGTFGLATSGVNSLAAGFGVLHNMAVYLSAGVAFLLAPLRGLVILPAMIMASFRAMFAVVMAPFKVLAGLIQATYRGIMVLLAPVLAVAKGFFMLKLSLHSLGLQFRLLHGIMAILPPQARAIVAGLVALGVAGRAGQFAMMGLAKAANMVMFATMAMQNPLRAAGVAMLGVGKMALSLTVATYRATVAIVALARSATMAALGGLKSLAISGMQAAVSLGSRLYSAASSAVSILATLAAAVVVYGMKTAMGLQTAETVFGVLLKDMEQGKALMSALNATKVAPFFNSKQIQDAGRDLIKAGVPVTQVTTKLEQLGQIAVATKTPIEDLSRIYRQGMAKGAFQTDLVNQMAERGIDIYHALTHVTGLSGEALSKAMSDGKIGAAEMNAAIEHLTTGHGIYAGAVESVGQTSGGMFSRIGNNIMQALGAMFSTGNSTLTGLLQSVVTVTEGWKTSFVQLQPVVVQVMMVFVDAFKLWQDYASFVWANVYGQGELTFGNLIAVGMNWATKFRWFFQNFADIARFAFLSMSLRAVTAFNDVAYFFTDAMPAYLNWFSENWVQVFTDAGNLIVTVFKNIGTNIGNAMRQIWAYIKSGGTADLQFAFTPLLDGFKATVSELPKVPERAMTELEKNMNAQVESLGTSLADSFDKLSAEASASLQVDVNNTQLKDVAAAAEGAGGASETSRKNVENKAAKVNSTEGQSVVAQFMAAFKQDDQKEAAKANVKTEQHMETLVREVQRGRPLATRSFA